MSLLQALTPTSCRIAEGTKSGDIVAEDQAVPLAAFVLTPRREGGPWLAVFMPHMGKEAKLPCLTYSPEEEEENVIAFLLSQHEDPVEEGLFFSCHRRNLEEKRACGCLDRGSFSLLALLHAKSRGRRGAAAMGCQRGEMGNGCLSFARLAQGREVTKKNKKLYCFPCLGEQRGVPAAICLFTPDLQGFKASQTTGGAYLLLRLATGCLPEMRN